MIVQNIGLALSYFGIFSVMTVITVLMFTMLTRYNDWEEIQKGNLAAGMALGGKIFGVGNIVHYAILSNDSISQTAIWACIGLALLLLAYQVFEWLTPRMNVNREIGSGNKSVGFVSMIISVTFSFVIGSSIA